MHVIYISDDGKEFNDEFECEQHEWIISNPDIENIHIYDVNGNELVDLFSENTYDKSYKIEVPNESALDALHKFAEYTGFCSYQTVDGCGTYVYDKLNFTFEKEI